MKFLEEGEELDINNPAPDTCPQCGHKGLQWGLFASDDGRVWIPADCPNCGLSLDEVYTISHCVITIPADKMANGQMKVRLHPPTKEVKDD